MDLLLSLSLDWIMAPVAGTVEPKEIKQAQAQLNMLDFISWISS